MSKIHFLSFLPLFQPLIREEGDLKILAGILEQQQLILRKWNVTEAIESSAEDLQYDTLQRLEEEVAGEVKNTERSSQQLQMLCYDFIDLLKARYDPKGKGEWKWKAERELNCSSNTAQGLLSPPAQCRRPVSTGWVRKRKLPLNASYSDDSSSKRPKRTGNITQSENSSGMITIRERGRTSGNSQGVEQDEMHEPGNPTPVLETSKEDVAFECLEKQSASDDPVRQTPSRPGQSETVKMQQSTESVADRPVVVFREDFRICEAVLGLTAL